MPQRRVGKRIKPKVFKMFKASEYEKLEPNKRLDHMLMDINFTMIEELMLIKREAAHEEKRIIKKQLYVREMIRKCNNTASE